MISDDKIEKQEELNNYLFNNEIISNINGNNNRQWKNNLIFSISVDCLLLFK